MAISVSILIPLLFLDNYLANWSQSAAPDRLGYEVDSWREAADIIRPGAQFQRLAARDIQQAT